MLKIPLLRNFFIFLLTALLIVPLSFAQEAKSIIVDEKEGVAQQSVVKGDDGLERDPGNFYNLATLQILNKVNAKSSLIEVRVGNKASFEDLKISLHKCWQAPLDRSPESKALLEVYESKRSAEGNGKDKRVFYGWMFASSPSISSMEHPVYDITVVKCKSGK